MSITQSQTSASQTTSHQSLLSTEDTSPFFSQEESPFVAQDISYENQSPLTSQGTHSFISQSTPPTPALQAIGTQISSPFAYQINNSFHLPQRMVIPDNQSFEVKFLTGYIKICAGCQNGYACLPNGKSLPAPLDLCLVHKEQHVYYNVVNNRQQLSLPSNVHYHAALNYDTRISIHKQFRYLPMRECGFNLLIKLELSSIGILYSVRYCCYNITV